MKRGKKIVINICLVLLLLIGLYYLEGYFLSREECELEYLEANSRETEGKVMSFQVGDQNISLYKRENQDIFDIVSVEKVGFLYKCEKQIDVTGKMFDEQILNMVTWGEDYVGENQYQVLLYKADPNLSKVIIEPVYGEKVIVDEWEQDFAMCYVKAEKDEWSLTLQCKYYCYDKKGNLLDEIDHTN